MLPDRVSNPGPLTYESGALPIALRGPAVRYGVSYFLMSDYFNTTKRRIFTPYTFMSKTIGHLCFDCPPAYAYI